MDMMKSDVKENGGKPGRHYREKWTDVGKESGGEWGRGKWWKGGESEGEYKGQKRTGRKVLGNLKKKEPGYKKEGKMEDSVHVKRIKKRKRKKAKWFQAIRIRWGSHVIEETIVGLHKKNGRKEREERPCLGYK